LKMSYEEKEKKLAAQLGEFVDDRAGLTAGDDPELLDAADAVAAIRGALGDAPDVNSAFSETLRTRLVREVRKTTAAKKPFYRRLKWMQYTIAASFFIFFLPTFWAIWEFQHRNKVELIEKYDKIYVPYTAQLNRKDYLKRRIAPFAEKQSQRGIEINRATRLIRMESTYKKYTRERRAPK
jgi:hypothetical protein